MTNSLRLPANESVLFTGLKKGAELLMAGAELNEKTGQSSVIAA